MMRVKKNISRIVLNINLAEDKGLFEPYVFNDTCTVLRRVQRSNPLFLSDRESDVLFWVEDAKESKMPTLSKDSRKLTNIITVLG